MNANAVMGMKFPVLPVMGMTVFAGMMNVLTLTKMWSCQLTIVKVRMGNYVGKAWIP